MPAFKGSGVYSTITDQSQSAGSAGLGATCIIPMLTHRGGTVGSSTGPFTPNVTLANYAALVGYDLTYNPNYLGLVTLLQTMAQVTVMRLNINAYAGNVILFQSGRYMSLFNLANPAAIGTSVLQYADYGETGTTTKTINYPSITPLVTTSSLKVYTAGTTTLVAHDNGSGTLVADGGSGVTGTITYTASPVLVLNFTGTKSFDIVWTPNEVTALAIAMNTPGNWGPIGITNIAASLTISAATAAAVSLGQQAVASSTIIYNAGVQIAHDNAGTLVADNSSGVAGTLVTATGIIASVTVAAAGTGYTTSTQTLSGGSGGQIAIVASGGAIISATIFAGGSGYSNASGVAVPGGTGGTVNITVTANTTINFSVQPTGSLLSITFVPTVSTSYTMSVYQQVGSLWNLLESQTYSTLSTASNYLNNLTWANLFAVNISGFTGVSSFGTSGSPIVLNNSSDGTLMTPSQITTSLLAARTETFIICNGLSQSYQNIFLQYVDTNQRFRVIGDVPAFATYDASAAWKLSSYATNRGAIYAVPDYVQTPIGSLPIQPSIKVMLGYANMFSKIGNLKRPVAGYLYGSTTATSLLATDYAAHPADLKNAKINYIKIGNKGPVIWEERSLYAGESDLAYNYVTFILDDIVAQLTSFMSSFTFKLIGASDLQVIQAGLTKVVTDAQSAGDLWSGKAVVPSFAAIQASGVRQCTIPVTVQVAQDGEEWTINVILTNVAVV